MTASEAHDDGAGGSGVPTGWIVAFALVFAGLVGSTLFMITADHLPARFVDVERTRLVPRDGGTELHLWLRHAPEHGQLVHRVETNAEGMPVVIVELSATGEPAADDDGDEDDGRELVVLLPDVDRVQVVDLRFGRDEAVEIHRSDGRAP